MAANGPPSTRRRVRRDDHRPRTAQVLDAPHRRPLVQLDTRIDRPAAQDTHEARRLHGRALGEEHALPEDRRLDALSELFTPEPDRLLGRADRGGRGDGLIEGAILCRRRGHGHHPALAQPDVLAERADGGDDPLARTGHGEPGLLSEHRARASDARPVAVQEAAVPPARAYAAAIRLENDDVRRRVAFLHRERRPQAGEPAADDAHVGVDLAHERFRDLVVECSCGLLEPPRRAERGAQAKVSR